MSGGRARAGRGERLRGCLQTCSKDMQLAAERPLCPPAVPLGTVVVPGDSDLELCRAHIERLQQVSTHSSGSSSRWSPPSFLPRLAVAQLTFACLTRSPMVLEPSPRCATSCHPSGVSWMVSLPCRVRSAGLWPARPPLRDPGLGKRRLGPGQGRSSYSASHLFSSHHRQPLLQD